MSRAISTLAAVAVLAAGTFAAPAAMADRALVIGASEEARRGFFSSGSDIDTGQALRDAGFEVFSADAGSVSEMRKALSRLLDGIEKEERVVVHLSGEFLRGAGRHWLVEAGQVARPDLATVDTIGLSLDTVLAVVEAVPGGAVVALGRSEGKVEAGTGLKVGLSKLQAPQGVAIVDGPAAAVAAFVGGPLLKAGNSVPEAIAAAKDVRGYGFLSERVEFLPKGEERPVAPPNAAEVERAIWQATLAQDSVQGYESYVERYPEGFFVKEAREAIERIRTEPNRQARLVEEALELSREDRRRIQRELTLLEYDPRGVDGVFGPGSRAAITRFQTKNGFPANGYLNETQIERLSLQAERRRAELAAEVKRRQIEAEKKDREAWAAVAADGDEAGLRTYLESYPKGLFAPIARERLDAIEAETRAQAAALEQADWDRAVEAGTVKAFKAYLEAHPKGAHADAARERIEAQSVAETEATKAAKADEAALNLNAVTRTLVERRLDQLGFEPGVVDGSFDAETRLALRRYQKARGLAVTGYMSQEVVSQMLADLGGLLVPAR